MESKDSKESPFKRLNNTFDGARQPLRHLGSELSTAMDREVAERISID